MSTPQQTLFSYVTESQEKYSVTVDSTGIFYYVHEHSDQPGTETRIRMKSLEDTMENILNDLKVHSSSQEEINNFTEEAEDTFPHHYFEPEDMGNGYELFIDSRTQ